jgi:hypothetical protein
MVNQFDPIAVEDVSVQRMTHHQCLAKSIHDGAWSQCASLLSSTAAGAGRRCVAVNPPPPVRSALAVDIGRPSSPSLIAPLPAPVVGWYLTMISTRVATCWQWDNTAWLRPRSPQLAPWGVVTDAHDVGERETQRCDGRGRQIPPWVHRRTNERFRRVEQVEQRIQTLLGIFAAHAVLPLEFKWSSSLPTRLAICSYSAWRR